MVQVEIFQQPVQSIHWWRETVPETFLVELIRKGWDKPMVEVLDRRELDKAFDEELQHQIDLGGVA